MAEQTGIETPSHFDIEAIRKDFPCLQQEVNEKPLIYLDSAASAQKPQVVIDTIVDFYSKDYANVHRAVHTLSERATRRYEEAREKVQHFVNAKLHREIIFVRGTTEAINLVATSFLEPRIKTGEEILITEMEHHANIIPWQVVCQNTGAILRVIPINDDGELMLDEFEKMLSPNVKFLALTHISNALGTINPLKEIIKMAHEHEVVVLVDGAQATPHMEVDVQDLDCDFYTFSGHKMYGPTGIGVLYGKADILNTMNPYQTGGEMISQVTFESTSYKEIPYKFEAGTPNIVGAIGLAAAIDYILDLGLDNIAAYEQALLEYGTHVLSDVQGIGLIGIAKNKASIISFCMQDVHAHDVGTVLNSLGIAVRSGHHCAMPLMERYQVQATTRASFAFYNTKEEIDKLDSALNQIEEVFS